MSREKSLVRFLRRAGAWAFQLLAAVWLASGGLWAQSPVAATTAATDGTQIKSIQQFWNLTPEQKSQPQDFAVDCTVTYFDPIWRILFVQDELGTGAYVPYGNNAYAFQAGEAITARGRFIPPIADFSFEHAVIAPRQGLPPQVLPATGEINTHTRFVPKLVSVEG